MWSGGNEDAALSDPEADDPALDLIVFARRCAIQALREGKREPVALGLRAVLVLSREVPGLRSALGLLSYASGHVGGDHGALFMNAADDASAALEPLLRRLAVSPLDEEGLHDFCGETLIETTSGRLPVGRGFEPYRPFAPLDSIAVELAAMVRADGYDVESVEVGKAPPRGLKPQVNVLGGAVLSAVHSLDDRDLTVYLFEGDEAAGCDSPCATAGRLCAVFRGDGDLRRFEVPATLILNRFRHGHRHRTAAAGGL